MVPGRASGIPLTTALTLTGTKSTIGWIRHNNFDRSAKTQLLLDAAIESLKTKKPIKTVFPDPVSKGGNLTVNVGSDASYKVTFYNTFTGKVLGSQNLVSKNQKLVIKVPKFTGDIAFRIEAVLA